MINLELCIDCNYYCLFTSVLKLHKAKASSNKSDKFYSLKEKVDALCVIVCYLCYCVLFVLLCVIVSNH